MGPKGIFYLTVALLTFAFTHITDKIGISKGVKPPVFSFFRILFGLFFVLTVWLSLKKKKKLKLEKQHIKDLAIIGSLSSGLGGLLSIVALSFTTATNKGVMQGMHTASTLIFAYLMLHERLPKLFYSIFITMIFGLTLLTSKGFIQLPNKGDWILFLTVPLAGFCNSYAKKTMKRVKSLTVSLGRYLFGALFLSLSLFFFGLQNISTLKNGIIWVVFSGILNGIRIITFYKGIALEGPTIAATMLAISPAITAISAFLILGETFNFLQILGLSLVIIGALILTRLKAIYKDINSKF